MKFFYIIIQIFFLLQDNAILLFLRPESLREIFVFHELRYVFAESISFSLVYKILRTVVRLFFSNLF